MRFNVNNYVRVKLTPLGRELHAKAHEEFWRSVRAKAPPYQAPKEDADGWSTWQLWCLMGEFGPHVKLGMRLPFESEIEIVIPPAYHDEVHA